MSVYVGVDWATDHHDVYVTNEQSEQLGAFRIAHSVEGVDLLTKRLGDLGAEPATVRVALERPDGLLVAALLERGYAVYPINPKSVDRYRDRHHTSGAKHPLRWVPVRVTPGRSPISCARTASISGRCRPRVTWRRSCA